MMSWSSQTLICGIWELAWEKGEVAYYPSQRFPKTNGEDAAYPVDVVVTIPLINIIIQRLCPRIPPPFDWIPHILCPRLQRTIDPNPIRIDLISSSKHNMNRLLRVLLQHIIPQCRSRIPFLITSHTKPVARMKHNPHTRILRGDPETPHHVAMSVKGDPVFNFPLHICQRDCHFEAPEVTVAMSVDLTPLDISNVLVGKPRRWNTSRHH